MKKRIIGISLGVLIVLLAVFLVFTFSKKSDSIRFKEEYESLNNEVRESDGKTHKSITIPDSNPIKYVTTKEALDVLNEPNAILYVGAAWCPWCRSSVPVLLEVAEEYNIDKIYYLNLDKEKSTFEIQNNKLVKTKNGSTTYYQLLDKLEDRLRDYILTDADGNTYDTNEKRIYMPYVVGIKNKEVVADHIGTVTLLEDQTSDDNLTNDQKEELKTIYKNIFELVYNNNSCSADNCD